MALADIIIVMISIVFVLTFAIVIFAHATCCSGRQKVGIEHSKPTEESQKQLLNEDQNKEKPAEEEEKKDDEKKEDEEKKEEEEKKDEE